MARWKKGVGRISCAALLAGLVLVLGACSADGMFHTGSWQTASADQEADGEAAGGAGSMFITSEEAAGQTFLAAEGTEQETEAAAALTGQTADGVRKPSVLPAEDGTHYAYASLETLEEKQLYLEILYSLQNYEAETEVSTLDQDLMAPVFEAVLADHPEVFYVDGYTCTAYRLGEEVKKLTFSGEYTMEREEIDRRTILLEQKISQWLSGMPVDAGDYEKAKYLYEYLISHTEYELGCEDSQNICSVLLNGLSVCQGYAKTLQLLCQRAGLEALLVTGKTNGQGHAWDLVKMDGDWYHMDPTWGDASYRQAGDNRTENVLPPINYDYFGVTTNQILLSHEIRDGRKLPDCTAVRDQYYRREGLFVETADEETLKDIFAAAIDRKESIVSFQCSDDSVFWSVYELLIEKQRVFEYLPDTGGKITYTKSESQRTFRFWV